MVGAECKRVPRLAVFALLDRMDSVPARTASLASSDTLNCFAAVGIGETSRAVIDKALNCRMAGSNAGCPSPVPEWCQSKYYSALGSYNVNQSPGHRLAFADPIPRPTACNRQSRKASQQPVVHSLQLSSMPRCPRSVPSWIELTKLAILRRT